MSPMPADNEAAYITAPVSSTGAAAKLRGALTEVLGVTTIALDVAIWRARRMGLDDLADTLDAHFKAIKLLESVYEQAYRQAKSP